MKKVILFPFSISEDNRASYVSTVKFAQKNDAEIVFYTALPQADYEEKQDDVYFHLLDLNGHFQTKNGWVATQKVETTKSILAGNIFENFKKTVKKHTPEWIVGNADSSLFNREEIQRLLSPVVNSIPIIL